jgi:hypothetical protein
MNVFLNDGFRMFRIKYQLHNIVTNTIIARQRPQHARGQKYRCGVFCGPRGDHCYATHDACGQQYRRGVFYVVRAMPSAGQRANEHAV